jgi:thioredoxin 2
MIDPGTDKKATIACPFCGKLNRVKLARAGDRPVCGQCRKPLLMDRPLMVDDDNFERLIAGSDVPVLVDFHADWCGPCKTMAPVLDDLARSHLGKAIVLKLDTDRNPRTASRFNISGIPTLILFRAGREVQRQVGAAPRQVLESMLAKA